MGGALTAEDFNTEKSLNDLRDAMEAYGMGEDSGRELSDYGWEELK
jgi:hypothetical protein